MVIDFKNINIKDIEGNDKAVDVSKDLANVLYNTAITKEGLEIAKTIYNNGEVEVSKNLAEAIKQLINGNFLAVIQESLNPILDNIISSEDNKDKSATEEPTVEEITEHNDYEQYAQ